MFGAMQLGQAGPNFNDVVTARGAAYKVFHIIDRVKISEFIFMHARLINFCYAN